MKLLPWQYNLKLIENITPEMRYDGKEDFSLWQSRARAKLAELLGVEKEKTAAIGDYYNDWEMLKAVGFPACCGQAPDDMKAMSKLVTCHCNYGAVADLIEHIITNG